MSLIQRQRKCDGRTYQAESVEQRVDGGWRNEDAVVQQLERPIYRYNVFETFIENIFVR